MNSEVISMAFSQLRVLSSGSLLSSPIRVDQLVAAAKARGYGALALTDVNVVYNLIPFYRQMRAAGLKPLLGMLCRLQDEELILLAQNYAGYQQLLRVSTAVQLADQPVLADLPSLAGLIAISTENSTMTQRFNAGDGDAAAAWVSQVQTHKPAEYVVGVPLADLSGDLPRFAQIHHLRAVPLGDVREIDPEDAASRRLLLAIRDGQKLRAVDSADDYHLPAADEVATYVQGAGQEALLREQDELIASIQVGIPELEPQLPHFPLPEGVTTGEYLRQLATAGLAHLVPNAGADYQHRLNRELGVIGEMGFDDYFLIVQDIIHASQERGIVTGPGRGSAAGSLVAFTLGITTVDPLKYGLLFERFLNPNRHQMPDIDIDVEDTRRGDVLAYINERYGATHTAQIMAFSTFGAKQALNDAAAAYELPRYKLDELHRALPQRLDNLGGALETSGSLQRAVRNDAQVAAVVRAAQAIEGLPRTITTHAAGVVLAAGNLTNTVALQRSSVGIGVQTQVAKEGVEQAGLLKIDILALRTLNLLHQMARTAAGQKIELPAMTAIPLDDPETLALFARGETNGVFQFESRPMRAVLRKVQPQSFEDVVATAALYRPGPMAYIDEFAKRRHNPDSVQYASPLMATILRPTYGIIVYQEQVMQVASTVGGLSLAAADDLRRAMSKKKQAVIDAARPQFMTGAAERGVDEQTAAGIFSDIERFAGYGFNRSHAVAYGMLAFWLAYYKAHAPQAFFAAQLNMNVASAEKTALFVGEVKQAGLQLLPPDINHSNRGVRVEKGALRLGFGSVHGMRRDLSADIIEERKQNGRFRDTADFLLRLDSKWRKADILRPLVAAGGLDSGGYARGALLGNLDGICSATELAGGDRSLLQALWPRLDEGVLTSAEVLEQEVQTLGFYLKGHPTEQFTVIEQAMQLTPINRQQSAGSFSFLGLVDSVRGINTKTGAKMAFLTVSDSSGQAEVTVFPEQYLQARGIERGQVYLIAATPDRKESQRGDTGERKLIAQSLRPATEVAAALNQRLFLNLGANPDAKMKRDVLQVLLRSHGLVPVIIVSGEQKILLASKYAVTLSASLEAQLKQILGSEAVAITKQK
jgi:DNA polymerase-3 subunit alpha